MNRHSTVLLFILGLPFVLSDAQAGDKQQSQMKQQEQAQRMEHRDMMSQTPTCPMQICDAKLTISDTPDGVAMTYTLVEKAEVETLRRQVDHVAAVHNVLHGMSPQQRDESSRRYESMQPEVEAQAEVQRPTQEAQASAEARAGEAEARATTEPEPSTEIRMQEEAEQRQVAERARPWQPEESPERAAMHMKPCGSEIINVESKARTEPVPDGERIVFVPEDPAQLDQLRLQVRQYAMSEHGDACPLALEIQPIRRR